MLERLADKLGGVGGPSLLSLLCHIESHLVDDSY
jgi:hypothetical protein